MKRKLRSQNHPLKTFAGVAVLVIAIGIILFSGASGISRESIERRLQQFADHISAEAVSHGKEAKFTYGEMTIAGWGYNKQAEIKNVTLEIFERALLDTNKWSVSTEAISILPDRVLSQRLYFLFSEPVNVIENSELKATVTFSSPPRYSFMEGGEGSAHTIMHGLYLPESVIINAAAAEGSMGGSTVITYDPSPVMQAKFMPEAHVREMHYQFDNLKIISDTGEETRIASLASDFTEQPGDDGKIEGKYTLSVSDFVLHEAEKSSKPFSLSVDISYRGDQPAIDLAKPLSEPANVEVKLNRLALLSDDFRVLAGGTIAMAADDPLPWGAVDITIDNPAQFIASDVISPSLRPSITALLQKVTAQPIGMQPTSAISLKREKNGVFYIGQMTFEQLTAELLSEIVKTLQQGPPVVLPPSPPPSEQPTAE